MDYGGAFPKFLSVICESEDLAVEGLFFIFCLDTQTVPEKVFSVFFGRRSLKFHFCFREKNKTMKYFLKIFSKFLSY